MEYLGSGGVNDANNKLNKYMDTGGSEENLDITNDNYISTKLNCKEATTEKKVKQSLGSNRI